ncbi:hypothetical protein ACFPM7_28000 [Actinokineospora guangxiensis]|uniref:DUF5753 domain-containing protein n=1 Tax=Actinokineospora guangxiensis TaxID=1490288 RepID=A0ABW0EXS4_9PSEU
MRVDLKVGAWIAVDDHCPMEFSIDGDGDAELLLGDRSDGFEFLFSPVALERFLALGAEALKKSEKYLAEEKAAELAAAKAGQ